MTKFLTLGVFLLHKRTVFFSLIFFKTLLDCDDIQYDHNIGEEIPSDASVLIDDLMAHVRLNVWQFFSAISQINEKGDLSVQIDYCTSAAVTVKK